MINEYKELIIPVLGLGFSLIGIIASFLAIRQAHIANKLSQKVVVKAEEANTISKEANYAAVRALEVSKRENISRFSIEIINIAWGNDGYLSDTIDKALCCGTFSCRFKIRNLSLNDALYMGFEKDASPLRSKGIHITRENCVEIGYCFPLHCLLKKQPIYDVSIIKNNKPFRKTEWRYETQLFWDNGVYGCSCKLAFEFGMAEYNNDGRQECKLYLTDQTECATHEYRMEEIFK